MEGWRLTPQLEKVGRNSQKQVWFRAHGKPDRCWLRRGDFTRPAARKMKNTDIRPQGSQASKRP